ncbi:hypothetical protein [Rhizobium leguminosarum]|uniref:hypothetical protein n=1 Tax=Rhizobium leguminosarum TaxID=384 RepID=UPI000480F98B|nr:hypothetical protein [Rhizobium leguminosarum]
MAFFGYLFGTWYGLLAVITLSMHVGMGFLGFTVGFFRKIMPNVLGDVLGKTIGSIPLVVVSSAGLSLVPAVIAIASSGGGYSTILLEVIATIQVWMWRITIVLLIKVAWDEFRSHYSSYTFWEIITLRFLRRY